MPRGNTIVSNDNLTVTTTTDGSKERLDVEAKISSIQRVSSPIHREDGWNNNQTKISYTVPTGKVLYIQSVWASHQTDAGGHTISFRGSGTAFYYMNFNNDGTTSFNKDYPANNPISFSAGTVITAYRLVGSSPEDWGAGFDGYLEDA